MSENVNDGEAAEVKELAATPPEAANELASKTVFDPEKQHEQPFDELAVTLSGGGYRAAAFHLGVLDVLNRVGLLQSVRVLSTVSGGTFTGMKYALNLAQGQDFEKFFKDLRDFLAENNIIGDALGGLQDKPDSPFAAQMPSLVRSAANVYASDGMFGDATFDIILDDKQSHLKEVSFNATEFETANYFRFQRSKSAAADIGNGNLPINEPVARMMRLADIAAASSGFPGAFEPIRFPDDFVWKQKSLEEVRSALGKRFATCVALMDGGIYDNQGVDSVITNYHREGNKVGLVIISDTNQRTKPDAKGPRGRAAFYKFAPEKKHGHITLGAAFTLAWVVFLFSLVTALTLLVAGVRSFLDGGFRLRDIFLYGFPLLLAGFVVWALYKIRRALKKVLESVAVSTTIELWPYAKGLPIAQLFALVKGRATSALTLTTAIFMKRIRDLIYRDIKVYPKYKGRQFENLIYDLDDNEKDATGKFKNKIVQTLDPTEDLRELAAKAEGVDTALWIKDRDDLDNLIACGQATTCFNLMRYILDCRPTQKNTAGSREAEIYARAEALWEDLKDDKYKLIKLRPTQEARPGQSA
ncbi:MAG TPA: patatin-like phospholipase family protein [Pyrinomonadaceae bacterium]|nr:patatin-like phospholipase family protein [Pyrinomonadaceae bacterium]